MSEGSRIIPPELENLLLEFTINVIVENPTDIVRHAAEYFTRLRDNMEAPVSTSDGEAKEEINKILGGRKMRRATVMGERYNPEEDTESEIELHPKTEEERQRINKLCENIFLFRVLDDSDVGAVVEAMIPKRVTVGETIIQQGDDGDFFYVIDEGVFDIFIKDNLGENKYIDTYDNAGYFGELALLHNQPRAATIIAKTDGLIWALDRKTFNRLIVKRAFEKRQAYMKLLDGVPHLKPLNEYEKMQVSDALEGRLYNKGDTIVEEGEEGDGMYFIVEGKVSVRIKAMDEDMHEEEVAQLGEGEFFGGKY